jgi:hypothetical protein
MIYIPEAIVVTQAQRTHTSASSYQHNITQQPTDSNRPSDEYLNHEISASSERAFQPQYNESDPLTIAPPHAASTVLDNKVSG